MKRRDFLRGSSIAAAAAAIPGGAMAQSTRPAVRRDAEDEGRPRRLRFFVVSDTHFGWRSDGQPTDDEVARNLDHLLERFPDLDFFVDSGDAHHSYAEEERIAAWTRVVQSRLGPIPMHFVGGNHELCAWSRDWNPEDHAGRLASLPARPYYSYDVMGIHFLVVPPMAMVSWIPREAMEFARLDLALNRDKTTILLSHNSLENTTHYLDDIGYRRTINSAEVLEMIRANPQVVAWMHGHNHTYELEPIDGVAYVSNGRFGGFNPRPVPGVRAEGFSDPGNNNLGGFLVDIEPRRIAIRAYNCSMGRFFDEIRPEYAELSWEKPGRTTLDPQAASAVAYGHGGLHRGELFRAHRHYAGPSVRREVHLAGLPGAALNDNEDFAHYTHRTLPTVRTRLLPGYAVRPGEGDESNYDPTWEWLDPGLRILAREDLSEHKIVTCPRPGEARQAYLRVAPGAAYTVELDIDAGPGGQSLQVIGELFHNDGEGPVHRDPRQAVELAPGRQSVSYDFEVPAALANGTMHEDAASDKLVQFGASARFEQLGHAVDIRRFRVSLKGAGDSTKAPMVAVGREEFGLSTALLPGQSASFRLSPQQSPSDAIAFHANGSGRGCVLVREEGVQWQVRNAHAAWRDGALEIGPLRNPFAPGGEVVIAPIVRSADPAVTRIAGASRCRVAPWTRRTNAIVLEVLEASGEVEVEVACAEPPSAVEGASLVGHGDGLARVRIPARTRRAEIRFA